MVTGGGRYSQQAAGSDCLRLSYDPFGGTAGDASGHVRQLVGSMIYAATFARTKLYAPTAFLRKLIREGVAGDATSIGTDYPMQ